MVGTVTWHCLCVWTLGEYCARKPKCLVCEAMRTQGLVRVCDASLFCTFRVPKGSCHTVIQELRPNLLQRNSKHVVSKILSSSSGCSGAPQDTFPSLSEKELPVRSQRELLQLKLRKTSGHLESLQACVGFHK